MNNKELEYRPKVRYWIPAGMILSEDLRKDVRDFYNRGFGSIEVVSFTTFFGKIEKGYRWGEENYINGILAILDEAGKLGMKVDIANGPQWPIAMPGIKSADDSSTLYEITYGISKNQSLPERRVIHDEGTAKLTALMRYTEIGDHELDENSYIDLIPYLEEDHINYPIGENDLVFAFYEQPAVQKVNEYYIIDHLSKEGTKKCEDFWYNTFYPKIQQYKDTLQSIFCDSLEYKVSLEWTRGMKDLFIQQYGYDICPYLPVIGTDLTYPKNDPCFYHFHNTVLEKQVNNAFYEMITNLYCNHHLARLDAMAKKIGMNIRYQVAYNKNFEISKSASSVTFPENEGLSRCSLDNLKSMGGAVHLAHKSRYSYECSAEFENGYGQTFQDILWWIKRSYAGGMNYQVFHGGTYNGKYDQGILPNTTFPGFEAFGKFCSNYWNRTLDIPAMNYHLSYIGKCNEILQKRHLVDLVIFRNDYLNNGKGWDGTHIVKDDLMLTKHGYNYDFANYLSIKDKQVTNSILDRNGPAYKAMIILPDTELCTLYIQKILSLIDCRFPVYIIGKLADYSKFKDDQEFSLYYALLLERAQSVADYKELIKVLQNTIQPYVINMNHEMIYHVCTTDSFNQYYYFYNGNQVDFGDYGGKKPMFNPKQIYPTIDCHEFSKRTLNVQISSASYPVILEENGTYSKIPFTRENNHIHMILPMAKDEMLIIKLVDRKEYATIIQENHLHQDHSIVTELSFEKDCYQFVSNGYYFTESHYEKKDEISSGYYVYTTELNIEHSDEYFLAFEEIRDTCSIEIDNQKFYMIAKIEPVFPIKLEKGKHQLKITVYTNLRNMLCHESQEYGIIGKSYLMK